MKIIFFENLSSMVLKLVILISKIIQYFEKKLRNEKAHQQQISVSSSDCSDYLRLKTKLIAELNR